MSGLFIETRGRGATDVVLIHGWAMHGGVFAPLVDALAERCTLHVVDLPGHGRSRECRLPLQPAACAGAIMAATPPALWLGWSLGGLVALTAALEYPEHVRGLAMLCASPCFVKKPGWESGVDAAILQQFRVGLEVDYRGTLERFLALEALGSDHARIEMRQLRGDLFARGEPDSRVLQEGLELLDKTDLRARAAALQVPSVWIAGARDRLVPWLAMRTSAALCNGHFTRIEHAGHAPFLGFVEPLAAALDPLPGITT